MGTYTALRSPLSSGSHTLLKSQYDLWYPVQSDRFGAARASPSFVAYLLITEAVGKSRKSQIALVDVPGQDSLAVYAIWDHHARKDGIARMVLLNMAIRNVTTSEADAAKLAVTVDLSSYLRSEGKHSATVKRMAGPGLDSKASGNVTWAGQSYEQGVPNGGLQVESLEGGSLTVQGSEGVLVSF